MVNSAITYFNWNLFNLQILYRIPFSHYYFDCLAQKMQIQNNLYMDPQASNQSLFSTQFVPLQKPIKSKKKSIPISESINDQIYRAKHQLISEISIICPNKLKASHFMNNLIAHRFEKTWSNRFGQKQQWIQQSQQSCFHTLKNIFEEFKKQINCTFHIVIPQKNTILYLCHDKITRQSLLIISSLNNQYFSRVCDKQKIGYELLQSQQRQKILIRNRQISIFWGYFMNHVIFQRIDFSIVSNFYFLNSMTFMPHETYNGIQQRPQYDFLAKEYTNILGKVQKQLYMLRVDGIWHSQNLEKLVQALNEKLQDNWTMTFRVLPISQNLTIQMFKIQDKYSESSSSSLQASR